MRVLGLYSKSNLLEDVLKMYKSAVNTYHPKNTTIKNNESMTGPDTNQVDYYSTLQQKDKSDN